MKDVKIMHETTSRWSALVNCGGRYCEKFQTSHKLKIIPEIIDVFRCSSTHLRINLRKMEKTCQKSYAYFRLNPRKL